MSADLTAKRPGTTISQVSALPPAEPHHHASMTDAAPAQPARRSTFHLVGYTVVALAALAAIIYLARALEQA
jgi:hypothetical protein